jgi:hypothetical protein
MITSTETLIENTKKITEELENRKKAEIPGFSCDCACNCQNDAVFDTNSSKKANP